MFRTRLGEQESVREAVGRQKQEVAQEQADYFSLLKKIQEEVRKNQVIRDKLAEVATD